MKKFLLVGFCLFTVLVLVAVVLRARIGAAILRGDPYNQLGWMILETDAASDDSKACAKEALRACYADWQRDERADINYRTRSALDVLRAGGEVPDTDLCRMLVGLSLAGVARYGSGLDDFGPFGDVIPNVAGNPEVTRAIRDYVLWMVEHRPRSGRLAFLQVLDLLARRGVRDDAELTAAAVAGALRRGITRSDRDDFIRVLRRLASPAVRSAGVRAALVGGAAAKTPAEGDEDWLLALVVGEMEEAPPAADEALARALVECGARHHGPRKGDRGMLSAIGEACVDVALVCDGLAAAMVRVAAAGSDAQKGFAARLSSEVTRIAGRSPAQILAYWSADKETWAGAVRKKSERSRGFDFGNQRVTWTLDRDRKILCATGAGIVRELHAALDSKVRSAVWLAARVLLDLDAKGLAAEALRRVDVFTPLAARFTWSAKYDHKAFFYAGMQLEECLQALATVRDDVQMLFPWFRALSIPEAGFAERSAKLLRARLTVDKFTDAMFDYLAVRPKFANREIDAYVSTLVSYKGVGVELERKLAELLDKAGKPESVGWIHKLIGVRALGDTGGASAIAVLGRYAADKMAYVETSEPTDDSGTVVRRRYTFESLAKKAAEKIEQRQRAAAARTGARRAARTGG